MAEQSAVALYDSLARWQWWRRKCSRAAPGTGLEIRKRLLPPAKKGSDDGPPAGPSDGMAGLDAWLMQQLGDRPRSRLLDLGCGFGASMIRWLGDSSGATTTTNAIGITPSGYQVARAQQVAKSLGLASQCTFLQQKLDSELPGDLDVVLAIEALGHTANLPGVLGSICRALRPGGTFIWLEDLLLEPADQDDDVRGLADAWSSPPLRGMAAVRRELHAAGLQIVEEIDLTAQVPYRSLDQIQASHSTSSRWQRLPIPFVRRICSAFAGGFLLERLYARNLACYRLIMAELSEVSK